MVAPYIPVLFYGEVTEWSIVPALEAALGVLAPSEGSNPSFSAITKLDRGNKPYDFCQSLYYSIRYGSSG